MLMLGFLSLLLALGAGVVRLGVNLPLPSTELVPLHGPLMVPGFLGTLISLERAVAVGQRWAYAGPALSAMGAALLLGGQVELGAWALIFGSMGLVVASLSVYLRQKEIFTATLLLGALALMMGNILWLSGWSVPQLVPWWMGFLVLTIAGERLELSRFLPRSISAQWLFVILIALLIAGVTITGWLKQLGNLITSATFVILTLWLVRYDVARRTVQADGLTRFIAVCLLSGYAWLLAAGLIGLAYGGIFMGPVYDAILHAVFLGFVFSMIFGHAPIIFPAVTGFKIYYHPIFYSHLLLLHLSLLARVLGDLAGLPGLRMVAGIANAITVVIFILNTVAAVVRARRMA